MKKLKSLIAIFLVFVLMAANMPMQVLAVSGIYNGYEGCAHEWVPADCETPATCYLCGETEGEVLGHDWQGASCEEPNFCPNCYTYKGMPLGHDMEDWVVLTEATCVKEGKMRRDCSRCNHYETDKIPANGHAYIEEVTEATCTKKGYTTYTCSGCSDSYTDKYVKALGHKWQAASCEEPKYCPNCDTYEGMPLGHDMGDWDILTEATCTKEGKMRRDCSRCDLYETEKVPANGHIYSEEVTEATCTQKGYTTHSCVACNDSYVDSYVAAPGHKWQAAGCEEPKYCPNCGTYEGMPLGHDMGDWDILTEATCTKEGKMRRECGRCDHYEEEVIPSNGHSYVPAVTEGSCTQPSYVTYTCTVCKGSYVDSYVAAPGHKWQEASCEEPKVCLNCNTVEGVPLGHAMGDWKTVSEATCTKEGKMRRDCSRCDHYEQEAIPVDGHNWEEGNCTVPKKCKTCGVTSGDLVHSYASQYDYMCDACGATRNVDMTRPMVDMFRMYDPNSGEHFYTGSMEERENLVTAGWHYEGVGFTFPLTTGDPVHRLYEPVTGEHLYTMNVEEMNVLLAQGWNYEGIAFNSGFENEVPQYRLHNPNATRGAYHFTASQEEKDVLIAAGWEYQGIGWYSLGA